MCPRGNAEKITLTNIVTQTKMVYNSKYEKSCPRGVKRTVIVGITAEYDPFHNGHAYMLSRARGAGDTVVAVMSGSVTQRGAFARFDKKARVTAALLGGADLCVELPVPWACAAAGDFALGAVYILGVLGAEKIAFGSECDDLSALIRGAAAIENVDGEAVRSAVKRGATYPKAVAESLPPEASALAENPNDLLAMEYIRACRRIGLEASFTAVKRVGAAHGSERSEGRFASASAIRELATRGGDYFEFVPDFCDEIYKNAPVADEVLADKTLLCLLRRMSAGQIAETDGVTEGMENRIYRAAREASSFSEATTLVKTKRYTLSRVRRVMLRSLIGIKKREVPELPPYIRVLGLNSRGASLLSAVKKRFPLLTKPSDRGSLTAEGERVFRLELVASELRGLALPPAPAGAELRYTPVVLP